MPQRKSVPQKTLERAYLFTLFALPLLFYPQGFDAYEIPKNIFFGVMTSLLIVGTLAYSLSKEQVSFPLSKGQKRGLILLLTVLALSLLTSLRPEISFFGTYYRQGGVLNALTYIGFFLVGLVYLQGTPKEEERKVQLFFKTVFFSGLLVALYAILQKLGLDIYESTTTDIFAGRSFSTLGNPTSLGTFLLFPLGAAAYFLATQKRARLLYGFGFLFLLTAMICSQSRGALLAVLLCTALLFVRHFKENKKVLALLALASLLSLIGFALVFSSNTRSLSSRFTIWESSAEILKESPFFGIGLENFSTAFEAHVEEEFFQYEDYRDLVDRPHNELLEAWIHLGFPGLLVFLVYALFLVKNVWVQKDAAKIFSSLTLLALALANGFGFSLLTQFGFMAAFLSLATHQREEKIKWKWSPAKSTAAFAMIFLFLMILFQRSQLFEVDESLKEAYLATVSGDTELANAELTQATQLGFMYGEVFNKAFTVDLAIAQTYQSDFFFQQAVAMNDQALALQGETLLNRLNHASIYELAGNTAEAEAVYQKASQELAPNPVLFQNWAELYYQAGRYEEALPLYESLLDLLPDWSSSPDTKRIFWKNHPDFETIFEHIVATYEILK